MKVLQSKIFAKQPKSLRELREKYSIMFSSLFSVDFDISSKRHDMPSFMCAEHSFTWLDYALVEKIINDPEFDLDNMDQE